MIFDFKPLFRKLCFQSLRQSPSFHLTYLQGDGRDLDPGHGMASADAQKKGPGPKGRQPIVVGDSLDPMVRYTHVYIDD